MPAGCVAELVVGKPSTAQRHTMELTGDCRPSNRSKERGSSDILAKGSLEELIVERNVTQST